MPRKKLSEFRAKTMVNTAWDTAYSGWEIDAEAPVSAQLKKIPATGTFVVKVDQAVKGRFKKGLVLLDVARKDLAAAVKTLHAKGYRWLVIEPHATHEQAAERYLSLSRDRKGLHLSYSEKGGVDIESQSGHMHSEDITEHTDWQKLAAKTGVSAVSLTQLVEIFEREHMVFLEINPYLARQDAAPHLLDLAIEVDDAGAYYASSWQLDDARHPSTRALSPQEQAVLALAEKSQASFKLDLINPNGSVFLLLSGGGASVVVADEVYNKGYGEQLANYGEYSGAPTTEETRLYTTAVLELLLASKARKKVLFIGGAVANFTDIATTFTGIIEAIDAVADKLKKQHVKVFVRRGGPRQEIGLAKLRAALEKHGLLGDVHGPEVSIVQVVEEALQEAK
jgi:ATP-citrate lyase beta-subunit